MLFLNEGRARAQKPPKAASIATGRLLSTAPWWLSAHPISVRADVTTLKSRSTDESRNLGMFHALQ
jgi:hypothetical protein